MSDSVKKWHELQEELEAKKEQYREATRDLDVVHQVVDPEFDKNIQNELHSDLPISPDDPMYKYIGRNPKHDEEWIKAQLEIMNRGNRFDPSSIDTKVFSDAIEEMKVSKDGGGLRYNKGKLRYDLQHPAAVDGLVRVLTKGAEKYAARNWERGMKWSDVLASLKRHLAAIERGEDYDPETGELHIDHLQCNAHFLSAYYTIYPQGDDRPHSYLDEIKIGLDIDEVLADWLGAWRELHGLEVPTSWWFDRDLMAKFEQMRMKGILDEFYLNLKPLIKPSEIPFEPHCYITSRPVDTKITEKWLDLHGFPARPVFTTTKERTKVIIAKEQNLDMFVDDGFHNFRALNEAGICTFLMDRPHNHRHKVGFKRITTLSELSKSVQ